MAERTNTNSCIHVRNLPSDFDEQKICDFFSQCGPIQVIIFSKMRTFDRSLISRGFGFIQFQSPESAQKAVDLSADTLKGIKVGWGKPRAKKQLEWPLPMPESFVISITPIVFLQIQKNLVIQQDLPQLPEKRVFQNLMANLSSSSGEVVGNSNPANAEARERRLRLIEAQTIWNNFSIFVSGLSPETAKTDVLHSYFSKCGPISCIIKNEPSLGVAKITFGDKRSAAIAILDLDGTEWMGGKLRCKWWTKSPAATSNQQSKQKANDNVTRQSTDKESHSNQCEIMLPKTNHPVASSPPPPFDAGNDSESTDACIAKQGRTAGEDSGMEIDNVGGMDSEKPTGVDNSHDGADKLDIRSVSTKQTMTIDEVTPIEVENRDSSGVFETIQNENSIFVSRLSSKATNEELLRTHFAANCGPVEAITILYAPLEEEANVGIAKIKFSQISAAARAIQNLDNTKWMGSKLRCTWWSKTQTKKVNKKVNKLLVARKDILWLPKTQQRIASPPPLFDVDNESESAEGCNVEQSRAGILSEFLRTHPELPIKERFELIRELLTSEDV